MLKINRERSERRKIVKTKRFGHKKILGPRPLGGGGRAPGAPPPLDPLVNGAISTPNEIAMQTEWQNLKTNDVLGQQKTN